MSREPSARLRLGGESVTRETRKDGQAATLPAQADLSNSPLGTTGSAPPAPYYVDDSVTIYHGDARDIATVPFLHQAKYVVVTDPPYPNNGGHFNNAVDAARDWLLNVDCEAIVFWSEIERPPVPLPLVAVHVWHRTNVNGKPYEPAYHFCPSGSKRRSEVFAYGVFFPPRGYVGDLHPTRKPVPVMQSLICLTSPAIVLDPFAGSGAILVAAKNLGRKAIGIEIEERYCEIAAKRCAQEVIDFAEPA